MAAFRWLAKYFAKHGPGSIGATAKVIAVAANRLYRSRNPVSPEELLMLIIQQRYSHVAIVSPMDQMSIVGRAAKFDGRLRLELFVQFCWEAENGGKIEPFSPASEIVADVVEEQCDKYLASDVQAFFEEASS